jgi:hypothetical protein
MQKQTNYSRLAVTVNGSIEWIESFLFQDLNDSEKEKTLTELATLLGFGNSTGPHTCFVGHKVRKYIRKIHGLNFNSKNKSVNPRAHTFSKINTKQAKRTVQ